MAIPKVVGTETEFGIIGARNSLVKIFNLAHRCDRTEGLLLHDGHLFGDAG